MNQEILLRQFIEYLTFNNIEFVRYNDKSFIYEEIINLNIFIDEFMRNQNEAASR
jgi:hypothetical protein